MKQFLSFLLIALIPFLGSSQIQIGEDILGEFSGAHLGSVVLSSDDGNRILTTGSLYSQIHEFDGTNWVQLGSNIVNNPSGVGKYSQALSGDGLTLARGYVVSNAGGTSAGEVIVYAYDGTDWVQRNDKMLGNHLDYFGTSIAMSNDGNRIAVCSREAPDFKGRVSVYEYNGFGWTQLGENIFGTWEDDNLGMGLSMSNDGNVIAMGTNVVGSNDHNGYARIYEYNGSNWIQLGNDISGNEGKGRFGYSISLSENGKTVAVGAFLNKVNDQSHVGLVQTYEYKDNDWKQKGEDLIGDGANDNFGNSIAMSNDGNKIAVGACLGQAEYSNPFGAETGSTRIYQFNDSSWENINMDIEGEANEFLGYAVALSGDGNTLICSSPSYDSPENEGRVRVFSVKTATSTSTINYKDQSSYNIYPNPTKDKIQIDLNKVFKEIEVDLFNVFGQKVASHRFYNEDSIELGLGSLGLGLYFARIKSESSKFHTVKIIKE